MEQEKEYYRELAAISHIVAADSREFCEAQAVKIVLDFIEKGEIFIPFLGTLKIEHIKDELIHGKVIAQLEASLIPSDFLVKSVGQHADGKETDAEKMYISKTRKLLKKTISEN